VIRLFWELIGKCAGLTMSMKEREADEIRIYATRGADGDRHECDGVRAVSIHTAIMPDLGACTEVKGTIVVDLALAHVTTDKAGH
jgi:hypothetical protein